MDVTVRYSEAWRRGSVAVPRRTGNVSEAGRSFILVYFHCLIYICKKEVWYSGRGADKTRMDEPEFDSSLRLVWFSTRSQQRIQYLHNWNWSTASNHGC